jgi:hypothetical protein
MDSNQPIEISQTDQQPNNQATSQNQGAIGSQNQDQQQQPNNQSTNQNQGTIITQNQHQQPNNQIINQLTNPTTQTNTNSSPIQVQTFGMIFVVLLVLSPYLNHEKNRKYLSFIFLFLSIIRV